MRDSTDISASDAHLRLSPWSPALVARLRARELRWYFCWRASILALIRLQVSGDINA